MCNCENLSHICGVSRFVMCRSVGHKTNLPPHCSKRASLMFGWKSNGKFYLIEINITFIWLFTPTPTCFNRNATEETSMQWWNVLSKAKRKRATHIFHFYIGYALHRLFSPYFSTFLFICQFFLCFIFIWLNSLNVMTVRFALRTRKRTHLSNSMR